MTGDDADAGDDARARRFALVHLPSGERRQLEERGLRVEQPGDALADRQLFTRDVLRHRVRAAAFHDGRRALAKLVEQTGEVLAIRRELRGRDVDAAVDDGHARMILARKGPGLHRANDSPEMAKIFECVPNISEGRRADVIDAARVAAADGKDVAVVDVSSDASHNRSVITLVGTADGVVDAAIRLAGVVVERIDLRAHSGEHPRMGAIDVIPFIPVGESTMDEAVLLARRCAQSLWERYRLPSYFYAAAATRPERRKLADVRKGEFEGLLSSVAEPD
ncbi:MAG TPA: hypothetical protein VIF62_28180, partial [Labilithrix sp.]